MRYLFSIFLLLSCQNVDKKTPQQQLIGIWQNPFNDRFSIEFTEDGYFNRCSNGENEFDFTLFMEENEEGKLEDVIYGCWKYKINPISEDSLAFTIFGEQNQKVFQKGILILNENELIEIGYKTFPGIENHIDEMMFYHKEGTQGNQKNRQNFEKIIIPKGFAGFIQIAYNQSDGVPAIIDTTGNAILKIPKNGILKTQLKDNPRILATHRYEFFEEDSLTGNLTKMRNFQHAELRNIQGRINRSDGNLFIKYPPDNTALFVYGFNQIGRDYLEKDYFNQKIEGNVMTFEVDTIGKRLRLKDYSTELKN